MSNSMRCLLVLCAVGGGGLTAISQSAPKSAIVFTDVTKEAGLLEPLAGMMGHGAAWGDFDGDGLIDLYVGGFCDRPNSNYKPASGPVPNRLLRNLGNGKFEVVDQPAVSFHGRTSGAVFADLDNNGTLELYVANNARQKANAKLPEPQLSAQKRQTQLFRNDKGKLVDISADSGACPDTMFTARNIGVFDYDGDGLLDLLVIEDMFTKGPRTLLLRNKGNLKFEVVNKAAGLPDDLWGLGVAVADINSDGKPDFFVPHSNRMFLSKGDGTYHEPAALRDLFAWKASDREDWPCGAAFGDLNRDGRLDLVLAIHGPKARNKVYLNDGIKDGVPRFRDVSKEVGFADIVPVKCPHVEVQDFDNDGWPDIYISAAWRDPDGKVTPLVYHNLGVRDGLPRFVAPRTIQAPMIYYPAGPTGDYDNDGGIDIFLVNWYEGDHSHLLHNDSPKRHWLDVRVVGKRMNRMGIGAQVGVYRAGQLGKTEALLGFQEMSTGYGYASGQPTLCHFGLADETRVDVRVTLPGGKTIDRANVPADKALLVEEP